MAVNKIFINPPVCNSCTLFQEHGSKLLKGHCTYWQTTVKRTSPICICVKFPKPKIHDNNEKQDTSNFAEAE